MDFADEVGKKIPLQVSSWIDPRGREQLGFSAEGRNFDELLFNVRTAAQKVRDEKRMDLDIWDYVPFISRGRQRAIDPEYGSLRMYQIAGDLPEPLVEDDEWEVEVTSCIHNDRESLTKDGRHKIRYTVKPLHRIVKVHVSCDFDTRQIITGRYCGFNFDSEHKDCDVRRARYRNGDEIIDVDQVVLDDKPQELYRMRQLQSLSGIMTEQHKVLGAAFDIRRFNRDYEQLPPAPEKLCELLGRKAV